MIIKNVRAREILDSRGNPTVETEIILENNHKGIASVPSGASTGSREAMELRDGENRYLGKGVLKAVGNVNNIIKPKIVGKNFSSQKELDDLLIKLDGTESKKLLGANAILSVSLAYFKACASANNKELYEFLGKVSFPMPMMNILNGGMHADNNLDFQEFMIVPRRDNISEAIRVGTEVFHTLKKILKNKGLSTNVGDEGGFAPDINSNKGALDLIIEAIKETGYKPGEDVYLALDVAASSFYDTNLSLYKCNNITLNVNEMIEMYEEIINKYPIISIEDPLDENDWDGFRILTEKLGNKVQLVGDDLFTTNKKLLQKGIDLNVCNAILIKANQIGTVSETLETIELAQKHNYKCIISHRSGETEDTFIADFAVGLGLPFIKTGSLSRGERVAKYNRLMKISLDIDK